MILSSSIDPDDIAKLDRFSTVIDLIRNPISFEILNELKLKYQKMNFKFPPVNHQQNIATQMIA